MVASSHDIYVAGRSSDALDGLEPSFLKENPQLVDSYKNIDWKNVQSLNALVGSVEQIVVKYKNPNDTIKNAIEKIYHQLLQRYPLFFGYWKRFTAVEYQLYGLEKSIATLEEAVAAFPNSLELWNDYMNVLCANSADDVDLIRKNFCIAKDLVGYQFFSHPFWDKYIEFESKHEEWGNLTLIYEELVTIPLHQYAKYGTACKSFMRSEKSTHQVSDLDSKLRNTQKLVGAIWPYESRIKQNFFNLAAVSEEELNNWDSYLDFLLQAQEGLDFPKEMITAVFERCLVPCLYYEHFWVKYTDWLESVEASNIQAVTELYQRGVSMLPRASKILRYKFLRYLKSNYRQDRNYIFPIFSQTIASYMKLFPNETSLLTEYLCLLKRHQFGSHVDQTDKEILSQQTSYSKMLESAIDNFLKNNVDRNILLQDMLTAKNFPILVVELIKITWLVLKNTMQTRKYFNFYSKNHLLQSSVTYWLTYYKFEKSTQNFAKLNKFINELGTVIFLPVTIINDILTDYQSFYLANFITSSQTSQGREENINVPSTLDPVLLIDLKLSDPGWFPGRYKNSVDWHKTREFKENGHPRILDDKPQVSNAIIENMTKDYGNRPPPLPNFRNLEKINQPLKYDDVFSKEYLNR